MTGQYVDQTALSGNISFTRPFEPESTGSMNLDYEKTYYAYLNWGIFDGVNDTDSKYLYGAKD